LGLDLGGDIGCDLGGDKGGPPWWAAVTFRAGRTRFLGIWMPQALPLSKNLATWPRFILYSAVRSAGLVLRSSGKFFPDASRVSA
jgi:hypothetical protein